MDASVRDHYEICQMLLEHGAIVDSPPQKVSKALLPIISYIDDYSPPSSTPNSRLATTHLL